MEQISKKRADISFVRRYKLDRIFCHAVLLTWALIRVLNLYDNWKSSRQKKELER